MSNLVIVQKPKCVLFTTICCFFPAKDDDESLSCHDPLMTLKKLSKEVFDKHSEKLVPKEFDAKSGLPSQTAAPTHSVKVDQAMEIWAQSKCGVIRVRNTIILHRIFYHFYSRTICCFLLKH